ncbi:Alpha-hemolysin translocation ATP-binding protein HlyB [Austwickia sp. TVS 96-490-7B]|nr:Alpha-hemolysin translocation ATP-binding protein HlyB [Austwickia sp. TVS 96-490-7B]
MLDDINMSIGSGDLVAVVGQSASGKSTLGKVICGLYEAGREAVEIGGHPLGDYDRDALRRQIGYVPQDVTLHNGTILENLAMGSDLDEAEIERRCRRLDFLDFIERLPMGYRTMVANLGANFSGSQRQRLAIARVLLRSPQIIVFGEATSALDQLNEQRVNRVLRSLGCTRIIIAHRLETVRGADTIYVIEDGCVVEQGTHNGLLESNGVYSLLYRQGVPA